MIPQIVHYCWFGHNELPPLAKKCIESWHKFLPNYEIKEWNESNFDVNSIPYTAKAYKYKKYAFVSDYARIKILYDYGGIYLDTDVEIIKSIDDIIEKGAFMGLEIDVKNASEEDMFNSVNPGLGFAVPAKHPFLKEMLNLYETIPYTRQNTTITRYVSEQLLKKGFKPQEGAITNIADINIYPRTFFNPFSRKSFSVEITENTRSIHHYASSWLSKRQRWINKHRYLSLLYWILHRPITANIKGLKRIIKEKSIWRK